MTVATTTTSVTVQGDGLSYTFNYTFPMGGSASYAVLTLTDGGGVTSTITSSLFSITGVTSSTGGTFTYPLSGSAITSGESLELKRVVPLVQNSDIANQGNFYASVVTGALDYEMMAIQQQQAQLTDIQATVDTLTTSTGSGTVTYIATGSGLSGGPITTTGTITLSTITSGNVLANFSGAAAAPSAVTVLAGTGISVTSSTTSMTIAATGAGGAGSLTLLAETALTASATYVTFSSITNSYRDLEIRVRGRGTAAATDVNVLLQFNGDTGSNYLNAGGFLATTPTGYNTNGDTSIIGGGLPAATGVTSYPGVSFIIIGDYRGTTFFKSVAGFGGYAFNTAAGQSNFNGREGLWKSTSAVSSVTVLLGSGDFTAGSVVSLYGCL